MAEMNQTQVKYARQRAQEIYTSKRQKLEQQLNDRPAAYSLAEKIQMLTDKKFEIVQPRPGDQEWYGHSIERYIRWPEREVAKTVDKEAVKDQLNKLKIAYTALTDELMLGDNQEALRLLKEFEAS